MFGRKAARIIELEEQVRLLTEERDRYRPLVADVRNVLGVPDGGHMVEHAKKVMDVVRAHESVFANMTRYTLLAEEFFKREKAEYDARKTQKKAVKKEKK